MSKVDWTFWQHISDILGNFLKNNWLEIISVFSIASNIFLAMYFGIKSWSNTRSIYWLEKYKFPKAVGNSKTPNEIRVESVLNNKLKSGKYQIVHVYETSSNILMVIVGRIKK